MTPESARKAAERMKADSDNGVRYATPRTICKACGKRVRCRCVGGDWLNAIYPERHKNRLGFDCDGSVREVQSHELIEYKPKQKP